MLRPDGKNNTAGKMAADGKEFIMSRQDNNTEIEIVEDYRGCKCSLAELVAMLELDQQYRVELDRQAVSSTGTDQKKEGRS